MNKNGFNAKTACVLPRNGNVMDNLIALMVQMKLTAKMADLELQLGTRTNLNIAMNKKSFDAKPQSSVFRIIDGSDETDCENGELWTTKKHMLTSTKANKPLK